MGMVQADDHQPLLVITRINPNGSTTPYRRYELREGSNFKDVTITAQDPLEQGANTFPRDIYGTTFDRFSTDADPEDFRWIVDLQGREFHGSALKLKRDASDPPTARLRPTILIPHGIFYSLDKTPDTYMRHPHPPTATTTRPKHIGKIADKVGADIVCVPSGGRVSVTVGQESFLLAKHTEEGRGFRYRINISNLCRAEGTPPCPPNESDFPLYYKAAVDEDGIQFDMRDLYVKGDPRGRMTVSEFFEEQTQQSISLPEFENLFSNGPPQVCNVVFLSKTTSIPPIP